MPPKRAFYCVVQYIPDGGRAEAANAGVALYVPAERWLETRLTPSMERVRQFFRPGKSELRRIERALESLKYRLSLARTEFTSESDLAQFVAARADAVRLTPPRLVMVQDALRDLNSLYEKLVGDVEHAATESLYPSLPPQVAEIIGALEASGKVWRPNKVIVPTVNRRLEVAFAFENGLVNYVRPESLTAGRLESRLEKLGFNGRLIHQHRIDDKQSKLVVLSSDPNADRDTELKFETTLNEFDVRFVPSAEAEKFAKEVANTAH